MNALVRTRLTAHPARCARDMAVMNGAGLGIATITLATLARHSTGGSLAGVLVDVLTMPALWVLVVAAGALAGTIGLVMPRFLDRVRGRIPLPVLGGAGLALGACWGSLAMLASSAITGAGTGEIGLFAALGALVFGLGWLPYVFQVVMGARRGPVVTAGAGLLGLLSGLAVYLTLF